MMAYNSRRILQLLKICCWKSESNLDFSGFRHLADQIDAKLRNKGFDANNYVADQRYLGQLLVDVKKNIEVGIDTGKNPKYIRSILNYLDFADWEEFDGRMAAAENALDLTKIDTSKFEQSNICFYIEKRSLSAVKQSIAFAQKKTSFQFVFNEINEATPEELFKELEKIVTQSQFIVWGIDDNWDAKLSSHKNDHNLLTILNKGQVVPIRIGETLSEPIKRLSFNREIRTSAGQVGLFMALAAIESCETEYSAKEKPKKAALGGKFNIGTFINKGTVATGDMKQENHGGNNVLGGNIIQNFPGKED